MKTLKRSLVLLTILSVVHQAEVLAVEPLATSFTYQGQLKEAGVPLNGNVDLLFELFDAAVDGDPIGSPLLLVDVPVIKGLFSVELDFGTAAFNGDARWAQIEVQVPQDGGGTLVVPLSPRQPLTGAPYALFSLAPWQQNGTDVSYIEGNVGIGTTAPQKALHLDLPSNADEGIFLAKAGTSNGTQLAVSGSNNQQSCIDIDPNNVSGFEQFQVRYNGDTPVLVIDENGNVGIGTSITPDVRLLVTGGSDATPAGGGYIQAGNSTGANVVIDQNEIMARNNGVASDLFLNKDGGGNVGIGTVQPAFPLHVVTDAFTAIVGDSTAVSGPVSGVFGCSRSTNGKGVLGTALAQSGVTSGVVGQTFSPDGRGVVGAALAQSGETYGVLGLTISPDGKGVVGEALRISGVSCGVLGSTLSPSGFGVLSDGDFGGTGAKFFVQPHPYDPSKEIRFVSLEGNESGTYFRGSTRLVDGRAYIDVPEEFRFVSELDGLTVQVTPMGPNAALWVESKKLDRIVVVGNGNVEFDYFVNGVRRGFADLQLIRKNHAYVPEIRGVPFGTQYREGHRQILVENGTLNADFTPKDETCARLGWSLREPTSEELSRYDIARDANGGT